ncbi:uncharacterized protein [Phyllobates terribilis]|uniref:uncharacterized protein n=1 Tax=Phyllobates terribilis TaxID=111132 RepID=UPI003CCB7392
MEFVRNMERRHLIKPQDILATLQSIPEDESESELQEHVFDSDSDEDFIPQNISSESEDSERTNPEDIPSTSTGDRAHAVMLPRDHPPGRGQKKSAKRPRNERTTDNDGGEGNATTNTREGESEGILVSADGIQWKPVEIGEHLPGRRDSQNILREAPGPTGYARRNIIIDSPLSAWRLFFDSYILTHIKNCTLAEACRNNNLQFTLSDEELDAFIAIFYARGISGTNRYSISSIWCNDWGIPFCKATMSRDRFVEIMRFLRFDEKSTRSERLQTDKFALFSTVWDRFIENCIACYKPGPYITVEEQLFPSKTRCPFTQYMPSKPDKYGHKYWLAVDKRSKYLANGFPYLGKDDTRRAEDRLADHVVMKLLDPFLKKGRNVTTDNYFTSVKLAKQLKSKGTTIVGTLNKIRREVPKEIKSMKEELYNTKVFRNEDNFTLTVYQGKPNKNVVILSSVHPDVVVASDSAKKTPETVKFYNETKYGVDVVDQMARKYTTRTCTRRWPVHAFENALDFAGINAWIIFKEITHQKMSRKAFLQTLVRELSGPYVTDREKGSTSQVSTCSEVMVQTKFCQIKEKCKKNRSVGNCKTCGNLNFEQRKALDELKKLDSVVIKQADKRRNIVLWPNEMYEKEAFCQLKNTKCSKKLTYNPLTSLHSALQENLNEALEGNIITREQRDFLHGTAMGVAFAPSYANLIRGLWEREIFLFNPKKNIDKVLLWLRFIDDIFVIWQGSEEDLRSFIDDLNKNSQNIILSSKYDQVSMDFLDLSIYNGKDNTLQTQVYRKPTAVNSLLFADSSHPKPLVNNIPTGEFVRIRRNCSEEETFHEQSKELFQRFRQRGYSRRVLLKAYRRACNTSRIDLLKPRLGHQDNQQVSFII